LQASSDHPLATHAELLYVRGLTLARWKRFREARECYAAAEAAGLRSSRFRLDVAWCEYLGGHSADALQRLRELVADEPQDAEIRFAWGVVLMAESRHAEAAVEFERTLELSPDYSDCWLNIAACHHWQGDSVTAESFARRAATVAAANDARPWALLGEILRDLGQEIESLATLRQARDIELRSGIDVGTLRPLVSSLMHFGYFHDAVRLCAESLGATPDPGVHSLYALALLTTGQHRLGWQQYEYRWLGDDLAPHRAHLVQPPWVGQPVAGKTILLRAEQGFGDAIQFARYAVPLKRMGATVILSVFEGLLSVAEAFVGPDRVVAKGERVDDFDFHIPLMSLPGILGQEAGEEVPVPYIRADSARRAEWQRRLPRDAKRLVGLVWAGNPKHAHDARRSLPLALARRLWGVDGVRFISLQKDLRPGDLDHFDSDLAPMNLGSELIDFADTAALISAIDLVICVDTAVAHLAGALGKEVWVLLPKVGDFRWGEGGSRSSWYPTMHLFRQAEAGNWGEVVDEVRDALTLWVRDTPVCREPSSDPAPPDDLVQVSPVAKVAETLYGVVQYFPDSTDVSSSIAATGEYMHAHLELLAKFLPEDAHVLEVGAGIGVHTLWLARALGHRGHVMASESDPRWRRLLRQNLAANHLLDAVSLPRGRLADGPESAPEIDEGAYTVDQLCLGRLDVLKVGRSAHAGCVLQGGLVTLYRFRPIVFAATSHAGVEDVTCTLWDAGYRCWQVEFPLYRRSNYYCVDDDPGLGEAPLVILAIPEERSMDVDLLGCPELIRAQTLSDA